MSDNSSYPALLLPHDYLRRAHDFYSACRALPDFHPSFMTLWPQHALFGHAIELVLKAYLLFNGVSDKRLKKYGHQLEKLHDRSVDLGLPKDARVVRMVGFINRPYLTAMARYPNPETMGDPVATITQFYDDFDQLVQTVNDVLSRT